MDIGAVADDDVSTLTRRAAPVSLTQRQRTA